MTPGMGGGGTRASPLRGLQLVLGPRVEVTGVVALVRPVRRFAGGAVDHGPAPDNRPRPDRVGPAPHVLVAPHLQELRRAVEPAPTRAPYQGQIATSAIVWSGPATCSLSASRLSSTSSRRLASLAKRSMACSISSSA